MVLFSKWNNCVYYSYRCVIDLNIVCGRVDRAVDNWL